MNRYVLVRWKDSSRGEEMTVEEAEALAPCIRESVGHLIHDMSNKLTLAMDRTVWPDGQVEWTHLYSINPADVVEKWTLEAL